MKNARLYWWFAGIMSAVALITLAVAVVVILGRMASFRIEPPTVAYELSSAYPSDAVIRLPGPNDGIILFGETRSQTFSKERRSMLENATGDLVRLQEAINHGIVPVED